MCACLGSHVRTLLSEMWFKNTSKGKCQRGQPLVNEILWERDLSLCFPMTHSISQHLDCKVGFVFDAGIWCFCLWCIFNSITCCVEVRSSICLWYITCFYFPPHIARLCFTDFLPVTSRHGTITPSAHLCSFIHPAFRCADRLKYLLRVPGLGIFVVIKPVWQL